MSHHHGRRPGYGAVLLALALAGAVRAATTVDLGSAGNFTVLAKTGVSTTGTTAITGHVGLSPAAASFITGFGLSMDASNQFSTSSLVTGRVYAADYAPPTPTVMTAAIGDMQTAYTDAAGRTLPDATELGAGNIGGMTIAPGLYKWSSGVTIPSNVTLAGGANAIWIFQIAQDLDIASGQQVVLSGGAQDRNIFWQVAGQATLDTTSVMHGNILCQTSIVMNSGATLRGKALAQTAVTMIANTVSSAAGSYAGATPPTPGKAFSYPSPATTGTVNLVYVMAEAGRAAVRIWNERGDLVASIEEPKLAGPQKTRVDVRSWAKGIYVYKIILTYDSGKVERLGVRTFAVAR